MDRFALLLCPSSQAAISQPRPFTTSILRRRRQTPAIPLQAMAEDRIAPSPADENALTEASDSDDVSTSDESINPPRDYEDMGSVGADLVSGDEVIARGWPRNYRNLAAHGFRPIFRGGTYPEPEIPDDIRELLDEDGTRRGVTIGPLSSIAWLAGLDELVDHIASPAYTIQDEIVYFPTDTPYSRPIWWLIEDGRISPHFADILEGCPRPRRRNSLIRVANSRFPDGVSATPESFSLNAITVNNRLQRPDGSILCMKLKSPGSREKLERKIRDLAGNHLTSGDLWYRGLSLDCLKSTLAFFMPQTNSNSCKNEFGPGFYTTDSLTRALEYIKTGIGALMVFRNPNLHRSTVWQLTPAEWSTWVIRWTSPDHEDRPAPTEYLTADFIKGRMSDGETTLRNGSPTGPGRHVDTQLVAVSYRGCQTLSASLYMIIFVEPR